MNRNIFLVLAGLLFGQYVVAQIPEIPSQVKFANLQLNLNADARKQISKKVEQITSDTAFFAHTREKVYTYMPIVMKVLKAQGVPEDLAYLALKETDFLQSSADDRKNPAGVWKITPNQNEDWKLNLQVTGKVDERKHIGLSTAAVARKLKNDNYTLRNWINTVLAFSFGFVEVSQTAAPDDKGKESYDFHGQTNPYLIDLVAYYIVFKPEFKPSKKSVTLLEYSDSKGKDLDNMAKLTGFTASQLKGYNTWLLSSSVPKEGSYTVYFPAYEEQKEQVRNALAKNNTLLPIEQYQQLDYPIIVKKQQINVDSKGYQLIAANGLSAIIVDNKDKSENVLKVANTISMRKFLKFNEIDEKDSIKPNVVYYLEAKKKTAATPFHELKKGETYWLVAQKYGMRYDKLLDYNRMEKGEKEQIGRILWLADQRPKETQIDIRQQQPEEAEIKPNITPIKTDVIAINGGISEDEKGKYYTTKMNETIYEIAAKVSLRLDSLRILNPEIGNTMTIEANTKLLLARKKVDNQVNNQLIAKNNPDNTTNNNANNSTNNNTTNNNTTNNGVIASQNNGNATTKTPVELTHVVQKGDWLNVIARKYGVLANDIMTWNKIKSANDIKINDKLVIKNPKQGFSMAELKNVPSSAKTNTENPNNVANNVANSTNNIPKKDTTIQFVEQPFLKDSVYLVRNDGETLESIEQKLKLPKRGEYNYSLYLSTWNNIDPVTTPLSKGRVISLREKVVFPSSEEIAKAMGVNVNQTAINTTQPNNTYNPNTTVPNIITANTEKIVMYADYKDSTYIVGTGDYLYSIAKKTGVPDYRYLLRWNGIIDENKKIDVGDRLIVKGDLSKPITYTAISNGKYHTTQFKENIYEIAKLYNTKADSIAKWNGMVGDTLLPVGKSLLVRKASMHVVQSGETLKKIAENYGMKPEELANLNKVGLKDVLKPNQMLLIDNNAMSNQGVLAASPKDTQNTTPNTNNYNYQTVTNQAISKDIYLVRNNGETLKSIAEKLKMPDVNGSAFYLYMQTWNAVADENTVLPIGKAIKIAEDAIVPTQQQIDAAMQNQTGQATQNPKSQLNQDALLTNPIKQGQSNPSSSRTLNRNSQPFKDVHVIKVPNETLKTIVEKYHLQPIAGREYYDYMKPWNRIDDENLALPIGKAIRLTETANMPTESEVLQIMPPPSASNTSVNGKHIVKQGETIYTISQQYNIDRKYLEVWNKIDDKTPLNAGQELIVQGDMRVEVPQYDKLYTDRFHIVQNGESLSDIAKFHKITLEELKTWNNLQNANLNEGQQLWIIQKPKMHKVTQGETLTLIASQYGLTLQDIAIFNELPLDYKVKIGEVLIVDAAAILPKPMIKQDRNELAVPPTASNTETVANANTPETYYAQFGETLQDVCSRFGVSTIDFKLWNKLSYDANKLEEGRKYFLKMPVAQNLPPASSGTPSANSKYKVGKNETLYTIARKFNITVYQLREWNNLKADVVKEGDSLVISK